MKVIVKQINVIVSYKMFYAINVGVSNAKTCHKKQNQKVSHKQQNYKYKKNNKK